MMAKPVGWVGESERHRLSRYGIRSSPRHLGGVVGARGVSKERLVEMYDHLVKKGGGVFFEKYYGEDGLLVEDQGNGQVCVTEWTDASGMIEDLGDDTILKTSNVVSIEVLLDPEAPHQGAYVSGGKFPRNVPHPESITEAAISYLAYWGGETEFVNEVGL